MWNMRSTLAINSGAATRLAGLHDVVAQSAHMKICMRTTPCPRAQLAG